jgi:hypothetical protein
MSTFHYCEKLNIINEPQLMYSAEESGCQLNNKTTISVFAEKGCMANFL